MPLRQTYLAAACALLAALDCGAASAAPVHIVAFGDSNTAGYLVPRDQAYPAQLQEALRKKGYDVVVDNAGVNGDTTSGALRRLKTAIAPGTDIAIVEFGVNDHRAGVPMGTVEARLSEIIRILRFRQIQVLLIGSGGLDFSDFARANDIPYAHWLLPPGEYRASDHAHYNGEGYAIVVARMLPQVETLIKIVNGAR